MTDKISIPGAGKITVLGAGAWGTALAQMLAAAGQEVTLYTRARRLADVINAQHVNDAYLGGLALDPRIRATSDLAAAVAEAELLLCTTPAQFFRALLEKLVPHLRPGLPLVNAAKGIEIESGQRLSEIAATLAPAQPYAVLSGPNFAHEAARGLPAAATFACAHPEAAGFARLLFTPAFRPYLSPDVAGAEIGGALKNVIAIACGIVDGKGLGENARAAVMTRGMAEIKRYGLRIGAQADTFLGLSGLGDLVLTCGSMASRNTSLGAALGRGEILGDILAKRSSIAEGVTTAKAVALHARRLGLDLPICFAVEKILYHSADIDAVIRDLLSRDIKEESA